VGKEKTVLVVSYDREYHDLFATALSLVGYRVLRTTDGQDALGLVLSKRPSLVILQYPVHVGDITLTASIRASPAIARTPILNITPRNVPDTLAHALVEGVDANLIMPVAPARLIAEVKTLIGAPG
jgi:DNA-binding response OmpR family regulator